MQHYCPICYAPSRYAPWSEDGNWPKSNSYECNATIEIYKDGTFAFLVCCVLWRDMPKEYKRRY